MPKQQLARLSWDLRARTNPKRCKFRLTQYLQSARDIAFVDKTFGVRVSSRHFGAFGSRTAMAFGDPAFEESSFDKILRRAGGFFEGLCCVVESPQAAE